MKKPMRNPGNIIARRPGLDGLRAIACLIVLINHAAGSALGPIEFGDTILQLGVGKIGVWLFFVLSAFLLSLQFISATYAPKFLPDYILGRILRILPAFVMAVVLYRFLGGAGIDNWEMVWFTITMQSAPAHLWTIPAEFAFYFVLPLIILPAIWLTKVFSFWAAAAFGVLTLIASIVAWPPLTAPPNSSWFGYYMPVFLSGRAAAVWARTVPVHKSSAKTITIFATVAVAVIIVVAKIAEALSGNELLPRSHFLLGPMFGLVVYGVYVGAPRWL